MSLYTINSANLLIKKCKTRNPFELAAALKIEIMFDNSFSKLKGFYTVMNRQPYIVINSNLSDENIQMVAAHELGHHILHKKLATRSVIKDFELYNINSRTEYEANSFAAEILISDDDISELIKLGYDMEQISAKLKVDINIVGIKLGNMNLKGGTYNIGITPKSDFLKNS